MNLIKMESDKSKAVRAVEFVDIKLKHHDIKGAIIFARRVQHMFPQLNSLFQFLGNINVHFSNEKITEEIDWYSVLGVHPLADPKLIKQSYYELATTLHPSSNKPFGSVEAYMILDQAWRILSDKSRREAYDGRRRSMVMHHDAPIEYPAMSGVNLSEAPFNIGKFMVTNQTTANMINFMGGARNPGSSSADRIETGVREICGTSQTIFAHQRSHTFWTACHNCGTPYQCPQDFINRFICCHQCHRIYRAVVLTPQVFSLYSNFQAVNAPRPLNTFRTDRTNVQPGTYNVSGNIRGGSPVISSARHSGNQTTAKRGKAPYCYSKESGIDFATFAGSSVKDPKESRIDFAHFSGTRVKDLKESGIGFHPSGGSSVKDTKESWISSATFGSCVKDPKESRIDFAHFSGTSVKDLKESGIGFRPFGESSIKDFKESWISFAPCAGSSVKDLKESRTGFACFVGSRVKDLKLKEKMSSKEDVRDGNKNAPPSHMAARSGVDRQADQNLCQKGNSPAEKGGVSGSSKGKTRKNSLDVINSEFLANKARNEIRKKLNEWKAEARNNNKAGVSGSSKGKTRKNSLDVINSEFLANKTRNEIRKKLNEWKAEARNNNKADKETPKENPRDQADYMENASAEGSGEDVIMTMPVPDSDFHDFDRDRIQTSFCEKQVWAAYDEDGMPRSYAFIREVSTKPFSMQVNWLVWLNSISNIELAPINWTCSGFPKTCGEFWVGKRVSTDIMNSFSHKVIGWNKDHRTIRIYPKKGDVWALYRNWSQNWSELTTYQERHAFNMVEVVEDYNEEQGVTVVPLVKVAGFKSVFREHAQELRRIPKGELLRFSHQVSFHLHTGQEAPKGTKELDPAALTSELLQVIT